MKGRVYRACVQRVLVYGSETWLIKAEDMHYATPRVNRADDGQADVWC